MNLVEFPLSAVADRFLTGEKTVVLADQIWDRDQRQLVARELAISGSDRYGLPTARDEDVLLACLQISRRDDFRSREVHFSRYELLKLLRWSDDSKSYHRLATSLRRWKGVTLYSNRAFYDHGHQSWVNRDFGIFDNLYLYERERNSRGGPPATSWFVWNDVLFQSFQAGYLKRLDWNLYCRLHHPVAKRLYRLLDKRFYHRPEVTFDLHELALRKIRVSPQYNTAQMKRALIPGIQELEAEWELRPLPIEQRFVRQGPGKWQVVFHRRPVRPASRRTGRSPDRTRPRTLTVLTDLEQELIRRQIGPATARDLAASQPPAQVRLMIDLFDWYQARGQAKGAGFLVDSLRRPEHYPLPAGFQSPAQHTQRRAARRAQRQAERQRCAAQEQAVAAWERDRLEPFWEYWNDLDEWARKEFEIRAVGRASPTKRDGYLRSREAGGAPFEHYRQLILRDHFEATVMDRTVKPDR